MAKITGMTADRMKLIEAASIVSGEVDENGNLILSRRDGELLNAGHVKGPKGDEGRTGSVIQLSTYVSGSGLDESDALQTAISTAMSERRILNCDVTNTIGISKEVVFGSLTPNSEQNALLVLSGHLKIKALGQMKTMTRWLGTVMSISALIELDGQNLANYCMVGEAMGRSKYGYLHLRKAKTSGYCITPAGNNNLASTIAMRVWGCGTKHVSTAKVTARSASDGWASTDDTAPYTTWTLDNPLPSALTVDTYAAPLVQFGDGRYMHIRRVVDAFTIEVFNENRPLNTTDNLTILSAAINVPFWGDSGVWEIGAIDVRDNLNAVGLAYGGYGFFIGAYGQQNNHTGVAILKRAPAASFGMFYTELSGTTPANTSWLVVRDGEQTGLFIGPGTNKYPAAYQVMSASWMNLTGRTVQKENWIMFKSSGSPIYIPPPPVLIPQPIDKPENTAGTRNLTPGTVQGYSRTSGAFGFRIDNNAANQGAVGVVSLKAPSVGVGTDVNFALLNGNLEHTIEGVTSYTRRIFGQTLVTYFLPAGAKDWKVVFHDLGSGVSTSIAYVPAYVGQICVSGSKAYIAVGTSSTADWKEVTNV